MFTHVVGANCNSPILQITHVTIHPHVEGLIAISPYTGVIRTFANIRVNTQKRHHGHGVSTFACVVGAKSASWRSGVCDAIRPHHNSPMLQFIHIANLSHIAIRPHCISTILRIHPCGRANCNSPLHVYFLDVSKYHVNTCKYTCKYLNTCKLMIERIYIPT